MKSSLLPAYCFGLLIFIIAALPGNGLAKISKKTDSFIVQLLLSDQFMHFFTFGILTSLIYTGYRRSVQYKITESEKNKRSLKKVIPYPRIIFLAAGYGVFIEIYQAFLPYRSFSLDDIIWNAAGVITSVFLLLFL